MFKLTPNGVYDKLLDDREIFNQCGKIRFSLCDISVIVKHRDVVGNILQEWLEEYFKRNNIYYSVNENTQLPPDFYLSENRKESLLEIKAFNYDSNPAFAIADFNMYQEELILMPWVLDTKYLIFGYNMDVEGNISIKDIWLKNVWEITCPSKKWALKLQVKRGVVRELRPSNVKKEGNRFDSKEEFLSAVEDTVSKNPDTANLAESWRQRFLENYENHYGASLSIPKWEELSEKFTH